MMVSKPLSGLGKRSIAAVGSAWSICPERLLEASTAAERALYQFAF
jgi:hypothetical protein